MSRRVSPRSSDREPSRLTRRPLAADNANESPASPVVRRVRAGRARETIERLTLEEIELVVQLDRVRFATRRQLAGMLDQTSPAAIRRLQRRLNLLVDHRVLARLDRSSGGRGGGSEGPVYAVDVIGQRLIATDPTKRVRPPWFVGERFAAHTLAITDAYVALRVGERAGRYTIETFETEPTCWRGFIDRFGSRQLLKPDAYVALRDADFDHYAFIEVDLATESLPTILRKARAYGQAERSGDEQRRIGAFPVVVWLAPGARRHQALIDTLGYLPPEQWRLHRVATTDGLVDALTTGPT